MSTKICLTPGFILFSLHNESCIWRIMRILRHCCLYLGILRACAVQCRRTTVRPHAWGWQQSVVGTRARSDEFSTKKNRIGQVKKRKRSLGKARKVAPTFYKCYKCQTMANLCIVEKIISDQSMGGSGSWYKWKVKLSQTVKI